MSADRAPAVPPITDAQARAAMDAAVAQVAVNLPLYTHHCQNHSSVMGVYPICDNVQWSCGFWPGEVWLSYLHTGDAAFARAGAVLARSFAHRAQEEAQAAGQDPGLLYLPSCAAAFVLTGDETARQTAVRAARQLARRLTAGRNCRRITCLFDLPLLAWAAQAGMAEEAAAAREQTAALLPRFFRPDGAAYPAVCVRADGTFYYGAAEQGYNGDSIWARGQAWGIYGSILAYRETRRTEALAAFRRAVRAYLLRLPPDLVPYWDLIFPPGSAEPRDSSAAAIAACGLLAAAHCLPPAEGAEYELLARRIVYSLAVDYTVAQCRPGFGQLKHGTYSKKSPFNTCVSDGVDECTGWGDYFYLEALTRLLADEKRTLR